LTDLVISGDFAMALPSEAVTHTMALLAVRGAGKTNGARVIAEEFFAAGLPFVAIDPVGSWWGLRAGRDGSKNGGLAIPILGGKHGDASLARADGVRTAALIVEANLSCVVDLSDFESEAAKKAFLLDFAKELYRINETARMLFLEEADDYIPQRPMREEVHLLRAFENIVRRGRSRGLGMCAITQRSASINKNVLTQVETLFVMRTTSPQDRAAVEAWVAHNDAGVDREMLKALPAFKSGEAWCWSPHLLGKSTRFRFRLSRTFDSGATPKAGEAKRAATLADVDLGKLQAAIDPEPPPKAKGRAGKRSGSTVDPGDDDPTFMTLRLELDRLREQLAAEQRANADLSGELAQHAARLRVEDGQVERLERAAREIERAGIQVVETARDLVGRLPARHGSADSSPNLSPPSDHNPAKPAKANGKPAATFPQAAPSVPKGEGEPMPERCRRVLTVLAQHGPCSLQKLALLSVYSRTGGSFKNAIGACRSKEWITPGELPALTNAGRRALGTVERLPQGPEELAAWWREQLEDRAWRILEAARAALPRELSVASLARAAGYPDHTGGSFKNGIGQLRTLGLVAKGSPVVVAEELRP